jgi:hypothetical protein
MGENMKSIDWEEGLLFGKYKGNIVLEQNSFVYYHCIVTLPLTRYRSVATDTKMTSSPTLTFSPSDLCLEAGWTVHQQASPWMATVYFLADH